MVTTEDLLPVSEGHVTVASTFWVEKQSGLIRRYASRDEGELLPSSPGNKYVSENERIYSVALLNPSSFADGTFSFNPRRSAVLVKQFQTKESQELAKLVGRPLPRISVKDSSGKDISPQSFQGKPLLLDFWATWCVPCRESLPSLEKLYNEYKSKGLLLLSLDEDEDPQKAADFWAQNHVPWSNYHLDKLSADKFPVHGIPYSVLVNSSGDIVFSQAGAEEKDLRAALAFLDSSGATSSPR